MSEIVQKLIGAFVPPSVPEHPLASIVEQELRNDARVQSFLASLTERPSPLSLHVTEVTETQAHCRCGSKLKDHENPKFFDAEVLFVVDLAGRSCTRLH